MKRVLSIALASVALVAAITAQDTPDFTGTWKLAGDAPDQFTPSQIVVAKDATVLTVTVTGQMGEFKTTYKLDGTAGSGYGGAVAITTRAVVGGNKKDPMISFYAAAIGVMFLLFTASGAAGALLDEVESGTLDRVLSSHITMTTLMLEHTPRQV